MKLPKPRISMPSPRWSASVIASNTQLTTSSARAFVSSPRRGDRVDEFALRHAVLPGRPLTIWLSSHRKPRNVNAFSLFGRNSVPTAQDEGYREPQGWLFRGEVGVGLARRRRSRFPGPSATTSRRAPDEKFTSASGKIEHFRFWLGRGVKSQTWGTCEGSARSAK